MKIKLQYEAIEAVDNGFERPLLRITPTIGISNGMRGIITFPQYEAWLDDTDAIKTQQERAIENAKNTLALFFANPARFQ